MTDLLTLTQAAKIIGKPPIDWMGCCYAVSCELAKSGVLPNAIAVYGAYLGHVAEGSMFKSGMPFQRHGWVIYGTGALLDPTQWVFENTAPYLFWSIASNSDYDEGNNSVRRAFQRPAPKYDPLEKQFLLRPHLTEPVWRAVAKMLDESELASRVRSGERVLCLSELFWLANLPLDALGELAYPLFSAFDAIGKSVVVPMDNFRRVMDGRWPGHARKLAPLAKAKKRSA